MDESRPQERAAVVGHPVRSAVLVPVYRDLQGALRLVIILRAAGGRHGGQIGFPGGKLEAGNGSLMETALRESREEIGLSGDRIVRIETLPEAVTQTTGFTIQPFLAYIRRPPAWQVQPREVQRVIEPRLAELTAPHNFGSVVEHHPAWEGPRQIDFFKVDEHRLWGASFRILQPLLPRLLDDTQPV